MNEAMKAAWLEISEMLGEPTREELDVFLRTWQRAIAAERLASQQWFDALVAQHKQELLAERGSERNRLASAIEAMPFGDTASSFAVWIRNGGQP